MITRMIDEAAVQDVQVVCLLRIDSSVIVQKNYR
jgi:hypothetical protein